MPADATHFLKAIEHGNSDAAHQLLPLIYDELRKRGVRGSNELIPTEIRELMLTA